MEKQITSKSADALFLQRISGEQREQYNLLEETAWRASRYLSEMEKRPAFPGPEVLAGLTAFDESLPEQARATRARF